jgi:hypothetical protein
MLSAFVDKITSLGEIRTLDHKGDTYTNANLARVRPPEQVAPSPMIFRNLRGLINFLDDSADKSDIPAPSDLLLHIVDPFTVNLVGRLQPDNDNQRFCFAKAQATPIGFQFGQYVTLEDMVLALQCEFKQTDQRDALISMLGSVASEHVREHKDDGMSQSIQIKSGLLIKSEVKVTNPILLSPYRTFRECEQVTSPFIIRFKARGEHQPMVMLKDAGGEYWQLDAMLNIRVWLEATRITLPTILS